ncbi:MAG: hypothetical protein WD069_20245 [Planctomycetales bacterium]
MLDVFAGSGRELIEKAGRIGGADFSTQHADGGGGEFGERLSGKGHADDS